MDANHRPASHFHEDPGLQVCSASPPDYEGLQSYPNPQAANFPASSGYRSLDSHKEAASCVTEPSLPLSSNVAPTKRRRRRVLWIAVSAIIVIIVILIAVLGGVLGSRNIRANSGAQGAAAANGTSPSSAPSNATSGTASQTTTGRIRSTQGAWNGTAIVSSPFVDGHASANGFFIYQDYTGMLIQKTITVSHPVYSDYSPVQLTNIVAANGSGMGLVDYTPSDEDGHYHLVYIAPNGTICDATLGRWAFDSNGGMNGTWTTGSLSTKGWKAPTDGRATMQFAASRSVWGKEIGTWGARLYAGSVDGKLYMYSYDYASATWADEPLALSFGSAYGGVAVVIDLSRPCNQTNATVYSVAPDGTLQYQVQQYGDNNTQWPHGPLFSNTYDSAVRVANGSAIAVNWQTNPGQVADNFVMYVPQNDSAWWLQGLTGDQRAQAWGDVGTTPKSLKVMQGSDVSRFNTGTDFFVLIYQDQGDQLAWTMFQGNSTVDVTYGHFIPADH